MSKNKRIALIVVSAVLLAATAIVLICCLGGTAKESMNHEMPYTLGNLSFEPGEESPEVAITYTRGATATSTGSITKQIKAIVEPADAPDKSVTWEIKWAENASRSDQNIDNYIRIIPNSNDSTAATVECVKAFTGDTAVITVTTVKGGFKASIQCLFVGYPETLEFDGRDQGFYINDAKWNNKNIAQFDCGGTYNIGLILNNGVGVVGEQFNDWEISAVHVYGGITTERVIKNASGNVTSTTEEQLLPEVQQIGTRWLVHMNVGTACHLVDTEIVDGELSIKFPHAASSYSTYSASPNGSATVEFTGYIDGKVPYVDIEVTEKTSGLKKVINVRGIATVNGVTVNNGESLEF